MADVAQQAGVSVMTVSRVLNGFPGVAETTGQRVEEAVAALGYHANTAARVLAGGRSRTLGVMAVETEQFGPSHMLFGIEAAARRAGHLLSFVTLNRNGSDMATTLERLRASHVQGVIVVAPVRRVATRSPGSRAPSRLVVGGDPGMGTPTVTIDQFEGARGHPPPARTRAPHGPPRHGTHAWVDASARQRGWSDALRRYRAPRGSSVAGD